MSKSNGNLLESDYYSMSLRCLRISIYIYTHMYVFIYVRIYLCVFIDVCIYSLMYLFIYLFIISKYTYMYVYTVYLQNWGDLINHQLRCYQSGCFNWGSLIKIGSVPGQKKGAFTYLSPWARTYATSWIHSGVFRVIPGLLLKSKVIPSGCVKIYPLKMMIFHSYVSLPEGNLNSYIPSISHDVNYIPSIAHNHHNLHYGINNQIFSWGIYVN